MTGGESASLAVCTADEDSESGDGVGGLSLGPGSRGVLHNLLTSKAKRKKTALHPWLEGLSLAC